MLHIGTYRTVFTVSGVQFRFLRRMQSYSYSDVQSVGIGKGRSANAITMAFTDGHKMTVNGSEKQLIKARLLLSDKLPHLGRGAEKVCREKALDFRGATPPPSILRPTPARRDLR